MQEAADTGPGGLSKTRTAVALAALAACAACFITAENLPIGLLPQIAASMHTSLSVTGLLVTIYAFVVVVTTVPLSHLTRGMPRRILLAGAAVGLIVGSLGCAAAPDFATLTAARILTSAAQAIFWAVGPVEATTLVRPELRGRAVSAVFGGSATGLVLGIPVGTWLGHAAGWRIAFVALAGAGAALLVMILAVLPHRAPPAVHHDVRHPADRMRYRALVLATCLAVTGYFTAYTYANPFLVRVAGVSRGSVALVLFVAGLASTVGLASGGWLYARHSWRAITGAVGLMVVALLALFGLGTEALLAAVFLAVNGLGQSLLTVAGQTAIIELGPPSGTAWYSSAYNVGIASGPLVGGLALRTWELRATPLAGACVAALSFGLLVATGARTRRSRR